MSDSFKNIDRITEVGDWYFFIIFFKKTFKTIWSLDNNNYKAKLKIKEAATKKADDDDNDDDDDGDSDNENESFT